MTHLRPIGPSAAKSGDGRAPKQPWRPETFHASPAVLEVFKQASVQSKPGKDGPRLTKLRIPEGGARPPRPSAKQRAPEGGARPPAPPPSGEVTPLSLRDAAFALDAAKTGPWSARASLAVPVFPALPTGQVSLREVAKRFSASGAALRSLAQGEANVWDHIDRKTIVAEISDRLRDPMIPDQHPTGLCGPISVVMEFARRAPVRYVLAAKELLETGKLTCPTGREIEAAEELRAEPLIVGEIGQVDWLLAGTMRDDENIWEDVDGGFNDANGLETITLWDEESDWVRDVLDLPTGGYDTCFAWGEADCMKQAEDAVKAGGVAFFLIDHNLLTYEEGNVEEDMYWRTSKHRPRKAPPALGEPTHSKDDAFPPDHWVAYLGGLDLGSDPGDGDPVSIRLWSFGAEYVVTGTVDGFAEYLYGVVTGL